jgi:lipopolysaccharide export system permease protein
MRVLRRYVSGEIYRAVLFVLVAFLALFAFFDLMGELQSVGRGPYRIEHAFLFVTLGMPAYAYELMPIAALIGTIYVMAQLAARSEFTVMRASSLSMARAIGLLMRIAAVLAVATFVLGEFAAPKATDFRENFKRRIQGAALSAEFRSGLWAKDVLRDPASKQVIGSRFLNAGRVDPDGSVHDVHVFEFDGSMKLLARIAADRAEFLRDGTWRLYQVEEMRLKSLAAQTERRQPEVVERRKQETSVMQSDITPDILAVLLADPKKMSAVNLAQFSRHLQENRQRSDQYEIALWNKLLYPIAVLVMMILALPFAYVQARSGSLSLKVFSGIMIGLLFHLVNNLFSHIGLLNTWPPILTALTPSALFLLAAIASLWWVERH